MMKQKIKDIYKKKQNFVWCKIKQIKKYVCVLLCFVLGTTLTPYTTAVSAEVKSAKQGVYYGDLDGNGYISVTDLSGLNQAVNGMITLTADQKKRADLNGDGSITNADLELMQQYILNVITEFPVERQLASISITRLPDRLTYTRGLALDLRGMAVTAYYNNGNSKIITDYRIEGDTSTVGRQQIKVSYTEAGIKKSDSYYIRVMEEEKKTLAYDANGGSGAPAAQTAAVNTTMKISVLIPRKFYTVVLNANGGSVSPDYMNIRAKFIGWCENANGTGKKYLPGTDFKLVKDTTLYACYEGAVLGDLPVPSRNGYLFKGWYYGNSKVSAGTKIASGCKLSAQWEKTAAPTTKPEPDIEHGTKDPVQDNSQGGTQGNIQQGNTQQSGTDTNGGSQGNTGIHNGQQDNTGINNSQQSGGGTSNGQQSGGGTSNSQQGGIETGNGQQNNFDTELDNNWDADMEQDGSLNPDIWQSEEGGLGPEQGGTDIEDAGYGDQGREDFKGENGDLAGTESEEGGDLNSEFGSQNDMDADAGQKENDGMNSMPGDDHTGDSEDIDQTEDDRERDADDGYYSVEWNVSSAVLQKGKSTTAVQAYVTGEDEIIQYRSSNQSVVTVNAKGKIKAKKVGSAFVTVKTKHGCAARVRIKVQKKAVTTKSLKINKKKVSLKIGKTFDLEAEVTPITSSQGIKYMSSNPKTAVVSRNGRIKARKKGVAIVKVKSGKKVVKVKVTVK